jgi:hypothetical protein
MDTLVLPAPIFRPAITPANLARHWLIVRTAIAILGLTFALAFPVANYRCEATLGAFNTAFSTGFEVAKCDCKPFTIGRSSIGGCDWIGGAKLAFQ